MPSGGVLSVNVSRESKVSTQTEMRQRVRDAYSEQENETTRFLDTLQGALLKWFDTLFVQTAGLTVRD